MEIFKEPSINPNLAIALGFFDGVHTGHLKIIKTLIREAKKRNLKTAAVTFTKNPSNYFNDIKTPYIQTLKDKEKILEKLGLDYLYELDFSKVKEMDADEYIEKILIKKFWAKLIVVGFNHTFGKKRKGNSKYLAQLAKNFGYDCIIIPEEKFQNQKISSTIVRKEIKNGNIEKVNLLLKRPLTVTNEVIKGNQVARKLGYPTINIIWQKELQKLPYGVYFGFVKINEKEYKSLISWGIKPTLSKENKEILEAHILNFKGDLYGKTVTVGFLSKIRDQKKFKDFNSLKKQLDEDFENIKCKTDV